MELPQSCSRAPHTSFPTCSELPTPSPVESRNPVVIPSMCRLSGFSEFIRMDTHKDTHALARTINVWVSVKGNPEPSRASSQPIPLIFGILFCRFPAPGPVLLPSFTPHLRDSHPPSFSPPDSSGRRRYCLSLTLVALGWKRFCSLRLSGCQAGK